MAKKITAATIVNKAKSYVGTKESPMNSNNVIFNTHYYGHKVYGKWYPWCAAFVWDIFRMCDASKLYYDGKKCAYCPTLYNFYKKKGQMHSTPKVGDIVLFGWGSRESKHVGIVTKVISSTKFISVEGNTAVGNNSNGGCVMLRERNTSQVTGFARPKYDKSSKKKEDTKSPSKKYTKKNFISDIQKSVGANVDGIAGPETLRKTPTLSTKKNKNHKCVKYVQKYLDSIGIDCKVTGEFDSQTCKAVKKFQSKFLKSPDGCIDSGLNTWKKLLF